MQFRLDVFFDEEELPNTTVRNLVRFGAKGHCYAAVVRRKMKYGMWLQFPAESDKLNEILLTPRFDQPKTIVNIYQLNGAQRGYFINGLKLIISNKVFNLFVAGNEVGARAADAKDNDER